MHELSIAQSIISVAGKSIPAGSKGVVTAVSLKIGELSSIEIESLQFAFSVIKENTVLQNAELNIETIEGEAECMDCLTTFTMHSYGICCPKCMGYALKICKGKELKITDLTIED
jgi:hydrogenase nickel incorporation protein HypA/HybF